MTTDQEVGGSSPSKFTAEAAKYGSLLFFGISPNCSRDEK
jgi:hypothetical protein